MSYNKDSLGNEYYALPAYAKTKNNEEIYAVKNGAQFYLSNAEGIEIMAKKLNSNRKLVPYFALDADGIPICPLLEKNQTSLKINIAYPQKEGKELYPKRWNREYYIDAGNGMKYAKNKNNTEYYATDGNGQQYYAAKTVNGDQVQYPITDNKGKELYIEENGIFIYPINLTKNIPVYPENNQGKELYLEKNNVQYYGRNVQKLPIYAKEKNKNDYFALKNGKPHYSFYEFNGAIYQYYPKLGNKSEFYLKDVNKEIYAKFKKSEKYAKTQNLDEMLANNNGIQYYATNELETEMYPVSKGKKFYRMEDNVEKIALNKTTNEGFYAKTTDEDEFYPKNFNVIPEIKIDIVESSLYREPTPDEINQHISSTNV